MNDDNHRNRRDWLHACAALLAADSPLAFGQSGATSRLIVPFTPGASNDTIGRLVADAMGKRSGRVWIVENKPGAGSQLGTDYVAKSAPDGTTLLLAASASMGVLPAIKSSMPYAVERDFTFLARVGRSPFMLTVNEQFPARSYEEFVRAAKAKPGSIRVGSSGIGALDYMGAAMLQAIAGIELNIVPYKGMSQVLNDLRAGHIDASIVSPATIAPLVADRKVRALAVFDQQRSPRQPDVPCSAELGQPKLQAVNWWGVVGPARLPPQVANPLIQQLRAMLDDPAFQHAMQDKGFETAPLTGKAFEDFVAADLRRWREVAKAANIQVTI